MNETDKLNLALRKLSGNADFKEVLAHLDDFCGVNRDNFVPDNERRNAYLQGRLSVALHFRQMMKEL